jgi:hypothetical protein
LWQEIKLMTVPTGKQLEFDEAMALEAAKPGMLCERYWEDGYLIVNGILTPDEAAVGRAILDETITLKSPEGFVHTTWGTRRQLQTPKNSIPALGPYAHHPRMLKLAAALLHGEVALLNEPIAVVSFTGKICGNLTDGNWIGHTDGWPTGPVKDRVGTTASIWLNFRDLTPGGGAMTMIPGSHWWLDKAVADPAFLERKKKDNGYTVKENLPGLAWEPIELCLRAGGVFVYNGYTIHNASDNKHEAPRQVCLYNFVTRAAINKTMEQRFDPKHLAVMSPELRKLV